MEMDISEDDREDGLSGVCEWNKGGSALNMKNSILG